MQQVSALYNSIISSTNHWFEISLVIGEKGRLIDTQANVILFGGTAILVDSGAADGGYHETSILSLSTTHSLFANDKPECGSAVAGEIDVQMILPAAEIPTKAMLSPYVRVCDATRQSEWVQKGVYFVDTRTITHDDRGYDVITIHGYDALAGADMDYPSDSVHSYPLLDTTMLEYITGFLGLSIDSRTYEVMNKGYSFTLPLGYSCREVLGLIAASYGGNFIISDIGELRLVAMWDIPTETNYLLDTLGNVLIFGEDENEVRLLV